MKSVSEGLPHGAAGLSSVKGEERHAPSDQRPGDKGNNRSRKRAWLAGGRPG